LRHGNTSFRAGLNVDVRANGACLGDKFEARQFFEQLPIEVCSFANEYQDICIFKTNRQLSQAFDGVGVDLCVVSVEFGGAV
jgi:hypothetical protein